MTATQSLRARAALVRAVIEPLAFQPPSEELFEVLRDCERLRHDMARVCAVEWLNEDPRGSSELTPYQMDRLLTRGAL